MKSQRLTLMISPEDKRHFQSMAKDRGMSMSELVREALRARDIVSIDDMKELVMMTTELRQAIPSMRRSLRSAISSADRAVASIASRQAKR
ncbi:MAG TPA: ribbon-helix-helix protein, CopG family [Rudaea sp.]|uniref:plasmid mobilization protein n=1 Tax=Rudaea sp. TaxID=2136325 RepID=UPI002F933AA1